MAAFRFASQDPAAAPEGPAEQSAPLLDLVGSAADIADALRSGPDELGFGDVAVRACRRRMCGRR